MNFNRLAVIVFVIALSNCSSSIEVVKGHAHNDYEHEHPLMDALKNGFISVEADVYLIDNDLYVSHEYPKQLNPNLTLEALYLKPLMLHVLKNNGAVYKNYSDPFYLMIDFKSSAKPTYEKLKEILSNYLSMISTVKNGTEQKGPVTVFISGERPIDEILADEPKLALIDGRPYELDMNIPASVMPVVSTNYFEVLKWNGVGEISQEDQNSLIKLVQNTHAQNKKLRLWAAPDNTITWKFLLDNGVDLINTDHLEEFRAFALKFKEPNK
jgi:hypothetical protein